MLFDYNINNCGWNNFLDPDWHNTIDFKIRYQKPKYINLDYRSELYKAVSALPDKNYAILYSGGIDSAVVMHVFNKCEKQFTPYVAEFWLDGKLLNEYELSFVNTDCRLCDTTPVRIELDIRKICENELDRLCSLFPTRYVERYIQMIILEYIPKGLTPVTGEGPPNISVNDALELYWEEMSHDLCLKFYSQYLELDECIFGCGFTTELGPPLIDNEVVNNWQNKRTEATDYKNYEEIGKFNMYNTYFPDVTSHTRSRNRKIVACNYKVAESTFPGLPYKLEQIRGLPVNIPLNDMKTFDKEKIYDNINNGQLTDIKTAKKWANR